MTKPRGSEVIASASQVLESAMSLPGVKHVAKRQSATGGTLEPSPSLVGLSDRVDIYLTLAAAQLKLGHVPEATKVIQDATNEFAGTSEEVRLPPCLLGKAILLIKPVFRMNFPFPALSSNCCSSYGHLVAASCNPMPAPSAMGSKSATKVTICIWLRAHLADVQCSYLRPFYTHKT
jgi:hypothetical protein